MLSNKRSKYNHTIAQCVEFNEKRNRRFIKLLSRLERSSNRIDKDMNKKYDKLRTEKLISKIISRGYELHDNFNESIIKLTKSLNEGEQVTIEMTYDEVDSYCTVIIGLIVAVR